MNGHSSVIEGSYQAGQEGGSDTRVMTPSGLWQKLGPLLMIGPCTTATPPLHIILHFPPRRPPNTFPTFWPLIPFRA